MDYTEEQTQEIEILESIYPDELERISETKFSVNIKLDTESERQHYLKLIVTYPETYPEVVPVLEVELSAAQLDEDDDDEDYEAYEDDADDSDNEEEHNAINLAETIEFTNEDLESLLRKLNEEAQENIGMPSVFALTSLLKDSGEQLFTEKLDKVVQLHQEEIARKEAEEQKKFIGTKVTQESYLEWRNKFREEMGIDKRIKERFTAMHAGKLTGKEIFEKGLVSSVDDDLEGAMEKLAV